MTRNRLDVSLARAVRRDHRRIVRRRGVRGCIAWVDCPGAAELESDWAERKSCSRRRISAGKVGEHDLATWRPAGGMSWRGPAGPRASTGQGARGPWRCRSTRTRKEVRELGSKRDYSFPVAMRSEDALPTATAASAPRRCSYIIDRQERCGIAWPGRSVPSSLKRGPNRCSPSRAASAVAKKYWSLSQPRRASLDQPVDAREIRLADIALHDRAALVDDERRRRRFTSPNARAAALTGSSATWNGSAFFSA